MNTAPAATYRQHLILIGLLLVGALLLGYYMRTRQVQPRLNQFSAQAGQARQQLSYLESQLATRQAMDLPAMRQAVLEAETQLRTAQLSGERQGRPFINTRSQADVAAFQAQISRTVAQHHLSILQHASVVSTDARLSDLIVRDLTLRGRFNDVTSLIDALGELPHRVVILSLDLIQDTAAPGLLRASLRYSL